MQLLWVAEEKQLVANPRKASERPSSRRTWTANMSAAGAAAAANPGTSRSRARRRRQPQLRSWPLRLGQGASVGPLQVRVRGVCVTALWEHVD